MPKNVFYYKYLNYIYLSFFQTEINTTNKLLF